jgi:hypothetical protein
MKSLIKGYGREKRLGYTVLESKERPAAGGRQPHRHLCADCLENVESSTYYNPVGLHGLLQG